MHFPVIYLYLKEFKSQLAQNTLAEKIVCGIIDEQLDCISLHTQARSLTLCLCHIILCFTNCQFIAVCIQNIEFESSIILLALNLFVKFKMNFPFWHSLLVILDSFQTICDVIPLYRKSVQVVSRSKNANNKLIKIPCTRQNSCHSTNKQRYTKRDKLFNFRCWKRRLKLNIYVSIDVENTTKCWKCNG